MKHVKFNRTNAAAFEAALDSTYPQAAVHANSMKSGDEAILTVHVTDTTLAVDVDRMISAHAGRIVSANFVRLFEKSHW